MIESILEISFKCTKMQLEMHIYFTNKGTQLWKQNESAFSHVRVAKTKQHFEKKDIQASLLGIKISWTVSFSEQFTVLKSLFEKFHESCK